MAKYRLLTGSHGRDENGQHVSYVAGQVMELSEAEVKGNSLKRRIQVVPEDDDGIDLSLMTVSKASSLISKLETVEEVVAFQTSEASGKGRKTVLDTASRRLQELAIKG